MERGAFAELFERGGNLHMMPDGGTIANARDNATAFTQAVIDRIAQEEKR